MRWWSGIVLLVACTSPPPGTGDTDPCLSGCDPCEPADTGPEAGCGAAGLVSIGTGVDGYLAHRDGEPWPLERGNQGLQHVMLSLWAPIPLDTLVVPRAALTVGAWRTEDGLAVSELSTSGWELVPDEHGAQITGVRVVLPVIDDVVGHSVGFDVKLVPVGATTPWHGWATGPVEWVDPP